MSHLKLHPSSWQLLSNRARNPSHHEFLRSVPAAFTATVSGDSRLKVKVHGQFVEKEFGERSWLSSSTPSGWTNGWRERAGNALRGGRSPAEANRRAPAQGLSLPVVWLQAASTWSRQSSSGCQHCSVDWTVLCLSPDAPWCPSSPDPSAARLLEDLS